MVTNCVHPNCKQTKVNENQLCEFHQNEVNGKSKWVCTYCEEHKRSLCQHLNYNTHQSGAIICSNCGLDEADIEENWRRFL